MIVQVYAFRNEVVREDAPNMSAAGKHCNVNQGEYVGSFTDPQQLFDLQPPQGNNQYLAYYVNGESVFLDEALAYMGYDYPES